MDSDLNICELLQYARHHGFARPPCPEDFEVIDVLPDCMNNGSDLAFSGDLSIDSNPDVFLQRERLALHDEAKGFLASLLKPMKINSLDLFELTGNYKNSEKNLKIEMPLLRTDNELDVRRFSNAKPRLPLLNAPQDEYAASQSPMKEAWEYDISWSPGSLKIPSRYENDLKSEKLEVDREALVWLQDALRSDISGHDPDAEYLWGENTPKSLTGHITPPLTPCFNEDEPPSHSSSLDEEFSQISDFTSPAVHVAKELNGMLMKNDSFPLQSHQLGSEALASIYSPLKSCVNKEQISSPDLLLAADLEVDETLLLEPFIPELQQLVPSDDLTTVAHNFSLSQDEKITESQDEYDAFFNEVIEVEACKVVADVENERLLEADSTMRLDVPVLDSAFLNPPWKIMPSSTGEEERENKEAMLPVAMMRLHHIPVARLDRQLQWVPFPMNIGTRRMEEVLEDDDLLREYQDFASSGQSTDHDGLSWKADGLKVLEEETEELEEGTFTDDLDIDHLVRKRKLDMSNKVNLDGSNMKRPRPINESNGQMPTLPAIKEGKGLNLLKQSGATYQWSPNHPSISESFLDEFSASDELNRFINVQTGKTLKEINGFGKLAAPDISTSNSTTDREPPTLCEPPTIASSHEPLVQVASISESTPHQTKEAECIPEASELASHERRPIIVASNLLSQHRPLIKTLKSLFPTLQLITRDFHAWSSTSVATTHGLSSDRSARAALPQHDEADIQISPGTGLLLTTLQKAKQKPLPGQGTLSALQTRILHVCRRHERVFVLVLTDAAIAAQSSSAAAPSCTTADREHHDMITLEPRDAEALAHLATFAATLASFADVSTCLVRGTAQEPLPLARWIAELLHANPLPVLPVRGEHVSGDEGSSCDEEGEWPLLQDETTWELVLRGAGLNAFAAQAVLLALRGAPLAAGGADASSDLEADKVQVVSAAQSGLSAFVVMPHGERRRRFAGLMGGMKVLDRVGMVFTGGWGNGA